MENTEILTNNILELLERYGFTTDKYIDVENLRSDIEAEILKAMWESPTYPYESID